MQVYESTDLIGVFLRVCSDTVTLLTIIVLLVQDHDKLLLLKDNILDQIRLELLSVWLLLQQSAQLGIQLSVAALLRLQLRQGLLLLLGQSLCLHGLVLLLLEVEGGEVGRGANRVERRLSDRRRRTEG